MEMILNGTDYGRAHVNILTLKARCDRLRRRIGDSRQAALVQAEIERVEKRIDELDEQMRKYHSLFRDANDGNSTSEIVTLLDVPTKFIQRRIRLGLSQSDLANACGQTRQCISRYERTLYNGASLAKLIQIDSLLRAEEIRRLTEDPQQMAIAL